MSSSTAAPAVDPPHAGASGALALVALASIVVLALCTGVSFRLAPGADLLLSRLLAGIPLAAAAADAATQCPTLDLAAAIATALEAGAFTATHHGG